ncbi:MAG: hypothetical protein QXG38_01535, partial [Candidatus Hadarchaeales archaeon]
EFAELYGDNPFQFFITTPELKKKFGERFEDIPLPAIGLYTYLHERIGVGLQQLMAGARKWSINLLGRDDLCSLTEKASRVTGIPLLEELETDVIDQMLG